MEQIAQSKLARFVQTLKFLTDQPKQDYTYRLWFSLQQDRTISSELPSRIIMAKKKKKKKIE